MNLSGQGAMRSMNGCLGGVGMTFLGRAKRASWQGLFYKHVKTKHQGKERSFKLMSKQLGKQLDED